jgi:tRNA G18 (ribose-2'-O)-methylase SpoU
MQAEMIRITDADDPRIADFRSLTDPQLRTLFEPSHGLFIAEGELILRRALAAGCLLRSVLVDEKRADAVVAAAAEYEQFLGGGVTEPPLYVADYPVLEAITGFHVHRGVLASFYRPRDLTVEEVLANARRIVIIEDVNNHTNLGSIIRSAAALGMDAVLLSPTCVDPLYRRVIRVSMGQVFAVPFARLTRWPAGLELVRDHGFTLLALTPDPTALSLHELSQTARSKPALLLGAEGPGLSVPVLEKADFPVRIPMHRGVDSLNVAVAGAIACYELGN